MELSGTINLSIKSTGRVTLDLSTPQDPASVSISQNIADGTGADKANQHWHDKRTLADGASEELDLAGGLTDAFGATVTFTKIKAIYIKNLSEDATLIVGGAASNAFVALFGDASDTLKILPLSFLMIGATASANGYAVGAGTADKLKFTHDGTGDDTMDYEILIIGEIAVA